MDPGHFLVSLRNGAYRRVSLAVDVFPVYSRDSSSQTNYLRQSDKVDEVGTIHDRLETSRIATAHYGRRMA